MEQLKELKQKGDRDKETLKKAIRAQKERAEKSEEYAEQLHVQLADKVGGPSLRAAGAGGRGCWLGCDQRVMAGRGTMLGSGEAVGEKEGKRREAG